MKRSVKEKNTRGEEGREGGIQRHHARERLNGNGKEAEGELNVTIKGKFEQTKTTV